MDTIALERVTAGAEWLDETQPDWFTRVDTETLQMSDLNACIIGQVFGGEQYMVLLSTHGGGWLMEHSFLFAGRDEWVDAIEKRLANAGLMLRKSA